jgi:hypothetical protein
MGAKAKPKPDEHRFGIAKDYRQDSQKKLAGNPTQA